MFGQEEGGSGRGNETQQHQSKNGDETRTDGEEVTGVGRGKREGGLRGGENKNGRSGNRDFNR